MKWVYIVNGTVHEVLPPEAVPVAEWYGEVFAAQCVEAPNEVEQRWTYDAETGLFAPPKPEEGTAGPAPSLESRVDALETETAAIPAAIERGLSL